MLRGNRHICRLISPLYDTLFSNSNFLATILASGLLDSRPLFRTLTSSRGITNLSTIFFSFLFLFTPHCSYSARGWQLIKRTPIELSSKEIALRSTNSIMVSNGFSEFWLNKSLVFWPSAKALHLIVNRMQLKY